MESIRDELRRWRAKSKRDQPAGAKGRASASGGTSHPVLTLKGPVPRTERPKPQTERPNPALKRPGRPKTRVELPLRPRPPKPAKRSSAAGSAILEAYGA